MAETLLTQGKVLAAATTGNSTVVDCQGISKFIKAYAVFSAGVTAGALVLEESPSAVFAGTWQLLSTLSFAPNQVVAAAVNQNARFLRLRVSTTVTGGTVDGYIYAI